MATSYTNPCGSGDRTALMLVTTATATSAISLVNGSRTDSSYYWGGSGLSLEFWFPSKKIIDEATFYQSSATAHGDWKWQGSNDRTTWTDIGSTFTLGTSATQTLTTLAGNTTAYSIYRLLQVSGSGNGGPYLYEFEFKIDEGGATSYLSPLGMGNRTATIAVTQVGMSWSGLSNLVDGSLSPVISWNNDTNAGDYIQFDLGASYAVQQARIYLFSASDQGVWKLQGSPDASTWTDVSGNTTIGLAPITCFAATSNTTAYRYYRLLGVSGSRTGGPYEQEVEFMVAAVPGDLLPAGGVSGATVVSTTAVTPGTAHAVIATRLTQLALEAFVAQSSPARTTQIAVEVFHPILVPVRTTQLIVEYFEARSAAVRATQVIVEVFLGLAPPPAVCPVDFLIDLGSPFFDEEAH